MRLKLVAMVLIMAISMPACVASHGFYGDGYSNYEYWELPAGYRYEFWDSGPVIVNALTGALVTVAMLRLMYPRHHWRRIYHEPHFVRDFRIPEHRRKWWPNHAPRVQQHRPPVHVRPNNAPNRHPGFVRPNRPGPRRDEPRFERRRPSGPRYEQNRGWHNKPPEFRNRGHAPQGPHRGGHERR